MHSETLEKVEDPHSQQTTPISQLVSRHLQRWWSSACAYSRIFILWLSLSETIYAGSLPQESVSLVGEVASNCWNYQRICPSLTVERLRKWIYSTPGATFIQSMWPMTVDRVCLRRQTWTTAQAKLRAVQPNCRPSMLPMGLSAVSPSFVGYITLQIANQICSVRRTWLLSGMEKDDQ